jgi:hypothetical protein
VLQWAVPFPSQDLDVVVAIGDLLIEELGTRGEVDGHDVGSREANIFIHTDRLESIFSALQPLLASRTLLSHTRAAYRAFDQDRYTIFVAYRPGVLLRQVARPDGLCRCQCGMPGMLGRLQPVNCKTRYNARILLSQLGTSQRKRDACGSK